jgi:hypothetical protein
MALLFLVTFGFAAAPNSFAFVSIPIRNSDSV